MNWISVKDSLPDDEYCHVLVACKGGNVDKSFFSSHREGLKHYGKGYSRKHQGKLSGYFSLSYQYGYEITHWMDLPEHPGELK